MCLLTTIEVYRLLAMPAAIYATFTSESFTDTFTQKSTKRKVRGHVHTTHGCCGDQVFQTCHKTAVTTTQSPHCGRPRTDLHVSRTTHHKPR